MKYTVTVTTPAETKAFTEWNYYEMVTRRFHALQHLHNLGFTVDVLLCNLDNLKGINANNQEATIITTKDN